MNAAQVRKDRVKLFGVRVYHNKKQETCNNNNNNKKKIETRLGRGNLGRDGTVVFLSVELIVFFLFLRIPYMDLQKRS